MPVSLPPISRRKFLQHSITATAALALGQGCISSRRDGEEHWALFSDIHIAADRTRVEHETNMTDNLIQVSREVLASQKKFQGVLISGDLALNSGETADYSALTGLLRPLRENGLPVHLALGNHDHRERFWNSMRDDKTVERSVADKQIAILRGENANWFVLDSLVKTLHTPGLLGETQRTWLAKALDENPDKPALIVIHHNPAEGYTGALDDTKELFEILRPRQQVKAYFFGHSHRWDISQDVSGIHLINLPPVAYLFELHRPNGWVRASLHREGVGLELRCINHQHKQQGEKINLQWRSRA